MACFPVLLDEDQKQIIMNVILTAENEPYNNSVLLTLFSNENPYFLFNCQLTENNISQLINNNTTAQVELSTVYQFVCKEIIPEVSDPAETEGDIATFNTQILEFSSKRGALSIPYFTIKFEAATEKELSNHVINLTKTEIINLKQKVKEKEDEQLKVQEVFEAETKEIDMYKTKISEECTEISKLQMELQNCKNTQSQQFNELKLENESLRQQLDSTLLKLEEYETENRELQSRQQEENHVSKEEINQILSQNEEEIEQLTKETEQYEFDKMNLENQIYGLKEELRKYENCLAAQEQVENANFAQGSSISGNKVFVSPAKQNISLETQSILEKYSKNPAFSQVLHETNPFERPEQQPPVLQPDIELSTLQTSKSVENVMQKYSQKLHLQEYKPYISPRKEQKQRSNLSSSTIALMSKYLKK